MKKKILIITYYWPPSGGPGVQRWLNFVRYLPEYDIIPIVFTVKAAKYPTKDKSLLKDIPTEVTVIRRPIFEPKNLIDFFFQKRINKFSSGIIEKKELGFFGKLLLWIRGNIFIPDSRVLWITPSVRFLKKYLLKESIDTIITTGPPHSMHLIGLNIVKTLPIKWIADFRDPWTSIFYHKTLNLNKRAEKLHQKLELEVLNKSNAIIVTSPSTQKEFETKTNVPVHLITNGYEQRKRMQLPISSTFNVSHIGTILAGRNPQILWEVFSEMTKTMKDFENDFSLQFAGKISQEILVSIKENGLKRYTKILGYLPHQIAIGLQESSHLLLLLEMDSEETKAIIPGKVFEYMAAKAPIIAMGPKKWDVEQLIKETKTGKCFSYDYSEKSKLKDEILKRYKDFKTGIIDKEQIDIKKYRRKNLTAKLTKIIS